MAGARWCVRSGKCLGRPGNQTQSEQLNGRQKSAVLPGRRPENGSFLTAGTPDLLCRRLKPDRVNVLGVGISVINLATARQAIAGALAARAKGYICVTDAHSVTEAQNDPSFRRILNRAFLCTPDGMPMVWMGRLAGYREIDRVYGPDLMLAVCEWTRTSGHTHFLFGGADGVAQQLKGNLEKKFPGIRIVGACSPPFRPLTAGEEAALTQLVSGLKPDIFWVGLGAPKQEKFMAQYLDKFETTLMVGVGAAFDFHTGRVRQAPRWMQRSGLEWFFRLGVEPRRLWKRYLRSNPLFIARVLLQKTGLRNYPLE